MYGGYLPSGLSGIAGERYAADDLRAPPPFPITDTAQGGTLRQLYGGAPRMKTRIYGEIPLEEIEGHQVDPFYDVRGGGLGQVPGLNRGRRAGEGGRGFRARDEWGSGDGTKMDRLGWALLSSGAQVTTTTAPTRPVASVAPAASAPSTVGLSAELGGIPTPYLIYGGLGLVAFMLLRRKGR